MPSSCTTPSALAECPVAAPAALAVVESEEAMQRRQSNAIGFDPLPEPFDAEADVRLVTSTGKVVLRGAPWKKNCEYRTGLSIHHPKVYRQWHDRDIGPVIDMPSRRIRPSNQAWGVQYKVRVCAMNDRGECLVSHNSTPAMPDTLAVFVSTDSVPPFTTVMFAEGLLGLGHLLRTIRPLLR